MKILIFGLPGSGKTTLAGRLAKELKCVHINADKVRTDWNDWDFSEAGRERQLQRMINLSNRYEGNYSITDFVCPYESSRKTFNADFTIWMNTIEAGRFVDTNHIFEAPLKVDLMINTFDYDINYVLKAINNSKTL